MTAPREAMPLHEVLKWINVVASPLDGQHQRLGYLVEAGSFCNMVVERQHYANANGRDRFFFAKPIPITVFGLFRWRNELPRCRCRWGFCRWWCFFCRGGLGIAAAATNMMMDMVMYVRMTYNNTTMCYTPF